MWCLGWFLSRKYALVDIGYFVGLTHVGKLSIQFDKVTRWIQIGDKARHMTHSNNFAQEDNSFIINVRTTYLIQHGWKNYKYQVHSLCLLLQVTFALSYACIEHDKQNLC
jgi:ABC-type multidrug transport system permease subunit